MSASYPSAVKSFANRSPGQTIGSAHINDLQDEVAAIESALVNGPINLQASTLASLSVAGASTFAGTVTFSTTVVPTPPACRLSVSATVQVAAGAYIGINWDVEDYDPVNLHSTSANSSRITLGSTGAWMVGYNLEWNANVNERISRLMLNDLTPHGARVSSRNDLNPHSACALIYASSATDYVTVQVQPLTSTGSISVGGTNFGTNFWAYRVR